MIKAKVINIFQVKDETLKKYGKIEAIIQKRSGTNSYIKEDIILTTKEMADYLLGENPLHKTFIEVIEVIPEEEKKTEKKTTKKKVKNGTKKDTTKKD